MRVADVKAEPVRFLRRRAISTIRLRTMALIYHNALAPGYYGASKIVAQTKDVIRRGVRVRVRLHHNDHHRGGRRHDGHRRDVRHLHDALRMMYVHGRFHRYDHVAHNCAQS